MERDPGESIELESRNTSNRRSVLATVCGLALFGSASPTSARSETRSIAASRDLNSVFSATYPTLGKDADNPTATFYGNFASSHSRQFATDQFEDVLAELVATGTLNAEFRYLSTNHSDPSGGSAGTECTIEPFMGRVTQGVWTTEPERFWTFFHRVMENPPSEGYFDLQDTHAALRAAGVRNPAEIVLRARRGEYGTPVRETARDAATDGVSNVPRIAIGNEVRRARADDLIPWLQARATNDPDSNDRSVSRRSDSIMDSTPFETNVYVVDAPEPGPTGFVVGGQHGIEPAGWTAAHELRELNPRAGTVIVVPEADRTAIRDDTYGGESGNLNRQWPAGSRPSSELGRQIWTEIERHDPDVVLDLHSSIGIYGGSPSGVGQAIFPTPNARRATDRVVAELNDSHVRPAGYDGDYLFSRGNDQTGRNPLLSHKVGADTDAKGFLFETTRSGVPLEMQVEWTVAAARKMLRSGGIVLER